MNILPSIALGTWSCGSGMAKPHYTTPALGAGKRMSLKPVSHEMLERADYVGSVDGGKEVKSEVFVFRNNKHL